MRECDVMTAGYRVSPALSSPVPTSWQRGSGVFLLLCQTRDTVNSKHKQQQIHPHWCGGFCSDLIIMRTILYVLPNFRLYSARCSACQNVFTKNDFVMRAKTKMFHLECFRCAACRRHLGQYPHFIIRANNHCTLLWTICCNISSPRRRVRSSWRGYLLQGGPRAAGEVRGQQQPGGEAAAHGRQPQADQDRAGGLQGQPERPRPGGGLLQVSLEGRREFSNLRISIPERTGWAVWTSRARLTPWGPTHPSVASPCLIVSTLYIVLRMATPWLYTVNCKKWELQGKTWCHDWA